MSEKIREFLIQSEPLLYGLLLLIVLLIFLTPRIVRLISNEQLSDGAFDFRVNSWRGLWVLIIGLLGHFRFYSAGQSGQNLGVKLLSILVIVYLTYLASHLIGRFLRVRYGRKIQSATEQRVADTYASRALTIFISVFLGIMALISVIRVAGFSSLLEAGGVIGFVGVFLALTQGAWAPDIISGLIILNSKMLEERDVIKLSDSNESFFAIVYRTRAFHTELLNLVDNHRIMIRNTKVRDYTVHNLSRFASARGLRETLTFKIGYGTSPDHVHSMFEKAYLAACEDGSIALESQYPLEIRVQDTGDHAIEWSVHYYTKDESALVKTRQFFREQILRTSLAEGIDLSTPITLQQIQSIDVNSAV